jgi:hypothetical protein
MKIYGKTITNPAQGSNTDIDWNGGTGMFAVTGSNFQSSTVKLQHNIGGTWLDIGNEANFTTNGATLFTTSANSLRVAVDGSGSTLAAVVEVQPVYENKAL